MPSLCGAWGLVAKVENFLKNLMRSCSSIADLAVLHIAHASK